MEELNNTQHEKPMTIFQRNAKTLKVVTIGILAILLLIPMGMIERLIWERNQTETDAINEVSQKWSGNQVLIGPYLNFDYVITHESVVDGKKSVSLETKNLTLLPDELTIDTDLATEVRSRGIYDVNVYQSVITLKGSFSSGELKKRGLDIERISFENATLCLGVSDMRGISEQIQVTLGDSVCTFESGMNGKDLGYPGVSTLIDIPQIKDKIIPYEINLHLKGSQSMFFAPIGKTTRVTMKADWGTPSFDGKFLPESHNITTEGFTAQWQVLNLNRTYPQTFLNFGSRNDIGASTFGVNLKMPVEQYQQSMRTAKYAILIIVLTFAVIFFVEIMDKKRIHAFQYLLIGLALCLFYSLLLSLSEQMNFGMAYLMASGLTIVLISSYLGGIMRRKKPAIIMGGLLLALYAYIYVLIQLETLALLAGSLGLFIILAIIMYFSKKIDWFNE
ncbi:MAG: cell envelope integrity protein CreD [Bacteroides sp.]|nr:cell envelope integrity protein CreD [Bacteroides sp.]